MSSVGVPPVGRANFFSSSAPIFQFYPVRMNNCNNTLCYTKNHTSYIYKPHTGYGKVGTSAAGYLASRKRL
jgi:hypothetical protein